MDRARGGRRELILIKLESFEFELFERVELIELFIVKFFIVELAELVEQFIIVFVELKQFFEFVVVFKFIIIEFV